MVEKIRMIADQKKEMQKLRAKVLMKHFFHMTTRLLQNLSIVYLLLPNLLFFYFWTNPVIAVLGIGVLLFVFLNQVTDRKLPSGKPLHAWDLAYVGVIATLLTLVSGIAGICFQMYDHWGHNVKFYELYTSSWPLSIPASGPAVSYYYGYNVVPALIFKLIGEINEGVIFLWTLAGFFLGIAWLYLVLESKVVYVLLCLCIGDIPTLVAPIFQRLGVDTYVQNGVGLSTWSLMANLVWVPNQVIPTLILGGMLVYLLKTRGEIEKMTFPIALSLWWAVFPALSCGLLVGILILRKWIQLRFKLDWLAITRQVFLPVIVCLPVLLLYESHREIPEAGFLWQFGNDSLMILAEYSTSIGVNFVLFLLLFQVFRKQNPELPDFPFYLLMLFLLVFPLYRMGMFNDLLLRGMMPYTLIIGLYLLMPLASEPSYKTVLQLATKSTLHFILLLMLLCLIVPSLKILRKAAKVNVVTAKLFPKRVYFKAIPYDAYPNSYEMLKEKFSLQGATEYLGKEDSFYEKKIR